MTIMSFWTLLIISAAISAGSSSRVLELSDRFLDVRKDGQWLVMFYAPWCGHCKRLEPVWAQAAQTLHNTNIRVGRVDCTRFTSVAAEFGISGFPTVLFLKGDESYVFKGDRTKEDIVDFALRLSGPPVQQLTKEESMKSIISSNPLFFVYVGEQEGPVWAVYSDVAENFQAQGFFYAVSPEIAKNYVNLKNTPSVFVFKENSFHFINDGASLDDVAYEDLNDTMHSWVNEERFTTFPKVTRGNIHQLLQTKKYLVLVVLQENKLHEIPAEMLEFRDMVESVIRMKRDKFHKWFQFGWVGNPELANSIAMTHLSLPYLLVVNSTTNHHHVPDDDPGRMTSEAVVLFLERIHNQSAPAYGGNSWPVRLYRTYFEMRTSLADMWHGNPVLTAVLFGLPLGFLSLICYSICCADIMDADEEEELGHEKKE
ncbi:LOW QUALITY PROTEIN: protein disulfide-isomerase TMX3 [Bacillus rossius redtenbacheri]|uniref:LOW QUALITY PROTEIN: protein disulfide-isomerase TMX3 n=1 Tax=Bacillus rossius redtenbacheri TaxID=93214 RepID=UPI002FDEC73B